jgi:alpha-L-fucosidase
MFYKMEDGLIMKYSIKLGIMSLVFFGLVVFSNCGQKSEKTAAGKIHFEPNWESLSQWKVPKWFDDAVLGIYCHWGVYSPLGRILGARFPV